MVILGISLFFGFFLPREAYNPPLVFIISSWILTVFIGTYLVSLPNSKMNSNHFQHDLSKKAIYGLVVLRKTNNNKFYPKYLAKVSSVNRKKSSGFVWIRIDRNKDSVLLNPGVRIITFNEFTEIKTNQNPGEFDYKEYSRKKRIGYQLNLDNNKFFKVYPERNSLVTEALEFRDRLHTLLNQLEFDEMERSLLDALLLGKKTDMKKEFTTGYRKAGAMHLLAISGLHVGILLLFIRTLLKPLKRWRIGKTVIKVIPFFSLWVFAFITGLSASVLRAVIMFSLISMALNFNRFYTLNPILFMAFFLSLLLNPLYLFDPGFQLSYLAVFSIVNLGARIRILWRPKNRIKRYLWNLMVVSIAAQIGVLPLILYYFHEFSGLFLVSSLLLIPLLGVILGFGYVLLIMLWFEMIPEFYIQIFSLMIGLMNDIVFFISQFDSFIIKKFFFSNSLLVISLLSLTVLFFYKTKEFFKGLMLVLLIVTVFMTSVFVESVVTERGVSFIVFHKYRNSLIIKRLGRTVSVIRKTEKEPGLDQLLENYQLEFKGLRINKEKCNQNLIEISGRRILIIDNDSILTDFGFDPDILLLLNSPKINLERFLKEVDPDLIVADGSNYNFLKQRWIKTAVEKEISFYDTAVNGAFEINI